MKLSREFIEMLCVIAVLVMGLVMGFMLADLLHYPIPVDVRPTPVPSRQKMMVEIMDGSVEFEFIVAHSVAVETDVM